MASYAQTVAGESHRFEDLKAVLACASPARSGDELAGIAATSNARRIAARRVLADLPLKVFLQEAVVPYESDEVTRLIIDGHEPQAFAPISHMTVGDFRDWLLSHAVDAQVLSGVAGGITPEMAAAVSKIMRNQDLMVVAAKCRVVTAFRNTLGLAGRIASRLQPNHPTDNRDGIAGSILDGLLYGIGDAVIGINPATDNLATTIDLLEMLDAIRVAYDIPTQSCVLAHITTTLRAIERRAPVDLVFQSVAGTEAANTGFGINLAMLAEGKAAAETLRRGTVGDNLMYFETGQGSALSADAHHGVDQQTLESRAYGVARVYRPLLVNSVVGFIGPEYLFDEPRRSRSGRHGLAHDAARSRRGQFPDSRAGR
jgi:ethanolamine ammonia-lyase large subunit